MYTIRQFLCPSSLEEAYQALTAARNNTVLGGCMWLRLGRRAIGTAIDLSALGLDRITDTGDTIEIGAMVSLRQLETSKLLRQQYGNKKVLFAGDSLEQLLDVMYAQAVNFLDNPEKVGEAALNFRLNMPLVGVGAPIHIFLPRVAALLGTEAVIP